MMNGERNKNSNFELINFEYLLTHPEVKLEVWQKYNFDQVFKRKVNEKMKYNQGFKIRFCKCFQSYINTEFKKDKSR